MKGALQMEAPGKGLKMMMSQIFQRQLLAKKAKRLVPNQSAQSVEIAVTTANAWHSPPSEIKFSFFFWSDEFYCHVHLDCVSELFHIIPCM
mmetsp:Transcript_31042/g.41018  ORF Transcript_31042/g.41018 Transcript_31042/m.41018 type:complete len:91 (-) Transcript_31042:188-460(-)